MQEKDLKLERQKYQLHKDGYSSIVKAIKEIPLPEIELPEQKEIDLKETNDLLRELTSEVKKKEEYEVEIDASLKEKLKGDPGEKGDSYILTDKDKKDIAESITVPVIKSIVKETKVIEKIKDEIIGEEIVKKINDLPIEKDKQIGLRHINGLDEFLERNYPKIIPGSGGLKEIAHDETLSGSGTEDDPLIVVGGTPGGGHTIQEEGTSLPQRTKLNFIGDGVTATDNAGAGSTDITISAGGTSDHAELDNLDFASAGHTGFVGTTDSIDVLADVDTTTDPPVKNEVLKWNGTNWVPTAYNASFTFSIATFTCTSGTTATVFEMGTASSQWKAIGAMSFSATYSNGPATGGYISHTGWSNLTMGGTGYVGPTTNATAANYPSSVGGTKVFTLNATDGTDNDTEAITYYFYNRRFWGISTVASGYTEANVEGLANNELSNSRAKTFSVTAGASDYIIYAYPSRLGSATFTVGGFEGGFQSPETVSITNASGFTENYYVYRSTNVNLGTTSVVVS